MVFPGTYTDAEAKLYWEDVGCTGQNSGHTGWLKRGTTDRIIFTLPGPKCIERIEYCSTQTGCKTKPINLNYSSDATIYIGAAPPPPPPTEPKIAGYAKDAITGSPIWLAIVTFGSATVYSGIDGYYEILNPDPISGYITCSKSGYLTSQTIIESPMEGTLTVNFNLIQG